MLISNMMTPLSGGSAKDGRHGGLWLGCKGKAAWWGESWPRGGASGLGLQPDVQALVELDWLHCCGDGRCTKGTPGLSEVFWRGASG